MPALLDALCQGDLPIMPKHMLEEALQERNVRGGLQRQHAAGEVVTSGAWRLSQYVPARRPCSAATRIITAFDQNKQRLPYLDELVFLVVPDQDAADLKFRSGGVDGLDDVKPRTTGGTRTTRRRGTSRCTTSGRRRARNFMWFNLNKVQPPVRGVKPTHGKKWATLRRSGEVRLVQQPDFRRAVSMAIDREAMITSVVLRLRREELVAARPAANKAWYSPDVVQLRLQPGRSEEAARRPGIQGRERRRRPRGHARQPGELHAEDQQQQRPARQHGELHQGRPRQGRHPDHADADRLQHPDHEPRDPISSTRRSSSGSRAACRRLRSSGQNVYALVGRDPLLVHPPAEAGHAGRGAHRSRSSTRCSPLRTVEAQKAAWKEIQNILNEQGWFIWLPILRRSSCRSATGSATCSRASWRTASSGTSIACTSKPRES